MSKIKNVLLIYGGGGTEHQISSISAQYIIDSVKSLTDYSLVVVEMLADRKMVMAQGRQEVRFSSGRDIEILDPDTGSKKTVFIDVAIPCIHGYPGETGDIQSWFEMRGIPFLGCDSEGSKICFNKINTKLWCDYLGIPNTPFIFLNDLKECDWEVALKFFRRHDGGVVVKASHQGSSVGLTVAKTEDQLREGLKLAFQYSPYALIEKMVLGRELEVSVYEYGGEFWATVPGEILAPDHFYSYDEKYSSTSKTKTLTVAPDLSFATVEAIRSYALKIFQTLKLRHLSRIDYFLTSDMKIYLNEINTFPGLTPISMFPKMMEQNGHRFVDFLDDVLKRTGG